MTEIKKIHLVAAYFDDESAAKEALKRLENVEKEQGIPFDGIAVVRRDTDGKIHLRELGDTHGAQGAEIGALIGGALGLLFGPLGVIGGGAIGAYYGGIIASALDGGIPNNALKAIGAMIPTGSAALVALTSQSKATEVEELLAEIGGRVVTTGGENAEVAVPKSRDGAE